MSLSTENSGRQPRLDSGPVRKYMFDLSFDANAVVSHAPERKPVLMKPDQIDAMKKESFDEGFAAGKKEGLDAQAAALNALLDKIDASMAALVQNLGDLTAEQQAQTRVLALSIAKKIVPYFAERQGMAEIEAVVDDALRDMEREPRLVVRVEEGQFDALNEKIQAIATRRAFCGKVVVIADNGVASGDCRVEWADGGVARDTQATWNTIEKAVHPSS